MEYIYDVIIIGGGPGGYSAALYTTRAGLDTLVIEKSSPGGQMTPRRSNGALMSSNSLLQRFRQV